MPREFLEDDGSYGYNKPMYDRSLEKELRTRVVTDDRAGRRTVYQVIGEQAGRNLVHFIENDESERIVSITEYGGENPFISKQNVVL